MVIDNPARQNTPAWRRPPQIQRIDAVSYCTVTVTVAVVRPNSFVAFKV